MVVRNTHTKMISPWIGFVIICLNLVCGEEEEQFVNFGVILPVHGRYPWVLYKTKPALELAVSSINNNTNLLRNYTARLVYRDSRCSETDGPLAAIDMYIEKAAHVFIGPACDYAVAQVARFSYKWGIPVISAGALVQAFHDKTEYRLLTRMMGSYTKIGNFVLKLLLEFNWKTVGLLFSDFQNDPNKGHSNCFFTIQAIFLALKRTVKKTPWHASFDRKKKDMDFTELLTDASENSRMKWFLDKAELKGCKAKS
ncbi:atrial natriuretic peptide receptor 1-like [Gigantopelta aegis]|uniref:atrial natriuretic peptide receptor 1-like n=1 Tax=Gigantopelta aegis TaxID=1735272 RepID=UPI001B88E2B0|nr:atrial natriuretic peptide receptor 1-like [Gigantopelta aegis]